MPSQRMTAIEALRGFTADAAWASFTEHEVGRLAPGMRADFVVLGGDPLSIAPAKLPTIKVISTWVDGSRVY
jgi:predicted amidohydrolase YtcJ